jgi:hypothetical protein
MSDRSLERKDDDRRDARDEMAGNTERRNPQIPRERSIGQEIWGLEKSMKSGSFRGIEGSPFKFDGFGWNLRTLGATKVHHVDIVPVG